MILNSNLNCTRFINSHMNIFIQIHSRLKWELTKKDEKGMIGITDLWLPFWR